MFEFCLYVSLVKEKLLTVDETNHFKGKARMEGLYKVNHALELWKNDMQVKWSVTTEFKNILEIKVKDKKVKR